LANLNEPNQHFIFIVTLERPNKLECLSVSRLSGKV
jgi:hypothetical protein